MELGVPERMSYLSNPNPNINNKKWSSKGIGDRNPNNNKKKSNRTVGVIGNRVIRKKKEDLLKRKTKKRNTEEIREKALPSWCITQPPISTTLLLIPTKKNIYFK